MINNKVVKKKTIQKFQYQSHEELLKNTNQLLNALFPGLPTFSGKKK